ncbi:MAG: hypothetical protein IIA89_15590 [Chloroflexi bacterium]|nr:hypothetical protein [Chloroflexota bacterium]
MAELEHHGDNPAVFYFQSIEGHDRMGVFIRLVFYEGVAVDVIFPEETGASPMNRSGT